LRAHLLLPLILSAACTEYTINPPEKPSPGADTDEPEPQDTEPPPDSDEPEPPPPEECNGKDDDLDGEVDEGFPDTDGDGTKDCLDDDCDAAIPAASSVTVDGDCITPDEEVLDPWNVVMEWQWTGLSSSPGVRQVIMTPIIGNLDDDDGDGMVTESDIPDVAFVAFPSTSFTGGTLVVLDGRDGSEKWSSPNWNGGGGIAMADVDGDLLTDIVGFDGSLRTRAVRGDGTALWTSTTAVSTSYPQATVADIDGDGFTEVIADGLVLEGATGALRFSMPITSSIPYRLPAVGDLDQDGDQEIIVGDTVYDSTGTVLWRSSIRGSYGHWAAIADTDGDPEAEVIMVGQGRMGIYEHTGTELVNVPAGTSSPGAPCVADFDGDGAAEVAWASSSLLNMFEMDGTRLWNASVSDMSGLVSCSGYDVNGDGTYEVLFSDEHTFYIFDGSTGAVLYSMGGHASGTLWEYPAVADIDNDGSAEVVIASNNYGYSGWAGVTVFGHAGDGWMKSGTTWHTHDFAVTNVNPDGTVPASPEPWWQVHNVYRARPAVDSAALDLTVDIADVCYAGCNPDSPVEVTVQIANAGGTGWTDNVLVSLYANNGGTLTLISTQEVMGPVGSGVAPEGISFALTNAQVGTDGLVVRVDDDGSSSGLVTECDESNNEDVWLEPPCGG
jgi:hypothetical protein